MKSKKLKQAINLALDVMGMKGPVTRRAVAEEVMARTNDKYWSARDERTARVNYLISEIAAAMNQPHGEHIFEAYDVDLPREYWRKISKLPRFICISPRGGAKARHVMTLFATVRHWEANFELKDAIAEATAMSRDESADMMRILRSEEAANLHSVLTGGKGEFVDASVIRPEQAEQPAPAQ